MNKKDIAFLFYPNDWLGGTQGFSFEHKGAYMELMIFQFNNGPMTIQDIKDVLGPYFDLMWERKLKAKFIFDDGKYFNKRVAESKMKREKYSQSRKENFEGSKKKVDQVTTTDQNKITVSPTPHGTIIEQYFDDLPNSEAFQNIVRVLKIDADYLNTFIEPFKIKAELEYPTFARFVGHFKNYVAQELKQIANGNSKHKKHGAYNADGLSQLNSAIKGSEKK